ncbi:MAG: carbonic anhydrase [Cyanobium sp. NAT70]|nr:carbonic anhydrase [Cyanobium sp. NAT70]
MNLGRRSFLLGTGLSGLALFGCNRNGSAEAMLPGRFETIAAALAADETAQSCRPKDILKTLIEGNERFSEAWQIKNATANPQERAAAMSNLWKDNCYVSGDILDRGQAPWATILTCADSRVSPEWIFDAAPSDLFVIRSAGNTAFNNAIASMEFAVLELKMPMIMVMGHSNCGAVKAALANDPLTPRLEELVTPIRTALHPRETLVESIQANAKYASSQICKQSKVIAQAKQDGALKVVASYFDIRSGKVSIL